MKNLILLFTVWLSVSQVFSYSYAAEDSLPLCEQRLDGKQYVQLGDGQIVAGLFKCNNCGSLNMAKPNLDRSSISCKGCGHPFDGTEESQPPPSRNIGGQTWVPIEFTQLSDHDVQLFKEGPNWICSSCSARNWQKNETCSQCGSARGKATALAQASVKKAAQVSDEANSESNSTQESSSFSKYKKIWITSAAFVALSGGLVANWAHGVGNPTALEGKIVEKISENVVFPDETSYKYYATKPLDLKHPPYGVFVVPDSTANIHHGDPGSQIASGVVHRQFYVTVKSDGVPITISVSEADYNKLQLGQKIPVPFAGPLDPGR